MATAPPSERRELLTELSEAAIAELVRVWRQAQLTDVDFAGFMIDAFAEVGTNYASVAADFAAEWFELAAPASRYVAVSGVIPIERLVGTAEWALGAIGDVALDRMSASLQRAVFDGSRETTQLNVERTHSRWAVHARPAACPWCRMMATRGGVFHDGAKALASCHDNGHCIAVEIREESNYTPPSYLEKWNSEYIEARDLAGSGDPKAIQAAWRQLITVDA